MLAKLGALGAATLAAAVAGQSVVAHGRVAPNPAAAAVVLVPETINGYAAQRRWHIDRPDTAIEEGALYGSPVAGADSVQLDFFRNVRYVHNAAFCKIAQGERLRSESLRTVKTRTGSAVFDVALLNTDDQLRLVAATECGRNSCVETRSLRSAPWQLWTWESIVGPERSAVVPASIVLVRQHVTAEGAAAAEQDMLTEFGAVAADLDLLPAQRLSGLLDRAGDT